MNRLWQRIREAYLLHKPKRLVRKLLKDERVLLGLKQAGYTIDWKEVHKRFGKI